MGRFYWLTGRKSRIYWDMIIGNNWGKKIRYNWKIDIVALWVIIQVHRTTLPYTQNIDQLVEVLYLYSRYRFILFYLFIYLFIFYLINYFILFYLSIYYLFMSFICLLAQITAEIAAKTLSRHSQSSTLLKPSQMTQMSRCFTSAIGPDCGACWIQDKYLP